MEGQDAEGVSVCVGGIQIGVQTVTVCVEMGWLLGQRSVRQEGWGVIQILVDVELGGRGWGVCHVGMCVGMG